MNENPPANRAKTGGFFVMEENYMNIFERMLNTQALMFIYVVTGIIMAKTKILKYEGR